MFWLVGGFCQLTLFYFRVLEVKSWEHRDRQCIHIWNADTESTKILQIDFIKIAVPTSYIFKP